MKLITVKKGDVMSCRKRGALRFLKGQTVTVAEISNGWVIPTEFPNIRLAPVAAIWKVK